MAELVDSGGLMTYFRKDTVGSNPTGCKYSNSFYLMSILMKYGFRKTLNLIFHTVKK